jgi:hypothetical protein
MNKAVLPALVAAIGWAVAQDQVPGSQGPDNRSEAASPAPPAQQNAPPDRVEPSPLQSPNGVSPDKKAEGKAPDLKMDSPAAGEAGGPKTARP